MKRETICPQQEHAFLTFSIGPVHTFIAQARKVADLWAGSQLLSHLTGRAIESLQEREDAKLIFPFAGKDGRLPKTLTNRFTCQVPIADAKVAAGAMSEAVESEWLRLARQTVEHLEVHYDLKIDPEIWNPQQPEASQAAGVIETSWSWIGTDTSHTESASLGVALSKASRLYRPFRQIEENDDKCAVCGERTALPDGNRTTVRDFWRKAGATAETRASGEDIPFLREGQTRLCLVCATKRFFPKWAGLDEGLKGRTLQASFRPFESFAPENQEKYFALVAMDGDKMGEILEWGEDRVVKGRVEAFRQRVSLQLTDFADGLIGDKPAGLAFSTLGNFKLANPGVRPQLIFAGGEDVLFVCHARDALPLAKQIRQKYREHFEEIGEEFLKERDRKRLSISAGILYAHVKHAAGLLFSDVTTVLDERAKRDTGRDAVALRLDKRSGGTIDVAFKWDEIPDSANPILHLEPFEEIVERVRSSNLSSSSSFDLRQDEETLREVFDGNTGHWRAWLSQALRRDGLGNQDAFELAGLLTPFFIQRRTDALRVARFLGREIQT